MNLPMTGVLRENGSSMAFKQESGEIRISKQDSS